MLLLVRKALRRTASGLFAAVSAGLLRAGLQSSAVLHTGPGPSLESTNSLVCSEGCLRLKVQSAVERPWCRSYQVRQI